MVEEGWRATASDLVEIKLKLPEFSSTSEEYPELSFRFPSPWVETAGRAIFAEPCAAIVQQVDGYLVITIPDQSKGPPLAR
jgi:hypothetical protein